MYEQEERQEALVKDIATKVVTMDRYDRSMIGTAAILNGCTEDEAVSNLAGVVIGVTGVLSESGNYKDCREILDKLIVFINDRFDDKRTENLISIFREVFIPEDIDTEQH